MIKEEYNYMIMSDELIKENLTLYRKIAKLN